MEVEETELSLQDSYARAPYVRELSGGFKSYRARLNKRSAEYFQSHPELLKIISGEPEDDFSEDASSSEDEDSCEYISEDEDKEMCEANEGDYIVIEDTIDDLIAYQDKVLTEAELEDANEGQYDDIQQVLCDKYTAWLNEIEKDRVNALYKISLPQSPLKSLSDEGTTATKDGYRIIEKFLNEVYASFKIPAFQVWQADKVKEIKITASNKSSKVLSKIGSYTLSGAEFSTLLPFNWLNDEIINSYFELISKRSEKLAKVFKAGIPRCIMLNSFFYPTLNGRAGYNYTRVSRWTRKYTDLFGYDKILIPINQPNHWVLVVINFAKKAVEYYDSLYGEDSTCTSLILRWLGDEWEDKYKKDPKYKDCDPKVSGWSIVYPKNIPRQRNGYDCGVFTCKNAECLSRSDSINFTQKDTPHLREVMMYELYKGKLLLDPTDISSKYI